MWECPFTNRFLEMRKISHIKINRDEMEVGAIGSSSNAVFNLGRPRSTEPVSIPVAILSDNSVEVRSLQIGETAILGHILNATADIPHLPTVGFVTKKAVGP